MKMGLRYVQPVMFVMQRFAVSVVALLPLFLILRNKIPRDKSTLVRLLILCLIYVFMTIVQAIGLSQESSGLSAVLTYTQPLFVFLLAIPFLKENVTKTKLLGITVGFAGVLIIFANRTGFFTLSSAFFMLLGAFLWATTTVYYKKFLDSVDAFVTQFSEVLVGFLPLILLGIKENSFSLPSDTTYIGILIISSIGGLATANVIWLILLKQEEATALSISSLIVPAITIIFGWQLLGENLGGEVLIGSALTLGGVWLVNLRKKKGV